MSINLFGVSRTRARKLWDFDFWVGIGCILCKIVHRGRMQVYNIPLSDAIANPKMKFYYSASNELRVTFNDYRLTFND